MEDVKYDIKKIIVHFIREYKELWLNLEELYFKIIHKLPKFEVVKDDLEKTKLKSTNNFFVENDISELAISMLEKELVGSDEIGEIMKRPENR